MNSRTLDEFWDAFGKLPPEIRRLATKAYAQFEQDPFHSGLDFKRIGGHRRQIWSVRVGLRYRDLGVRTGGDVVRFWIGTHAEYDELLRRL